ncbi:hypothetical protein GCM10028807_17270 [Spirosoma daeguense]
MKPILSQLLATAQLAEMAYNADQSEHKKAAWKKAQRDYDEAEKAEQAEAPTEQPKGQEWGGASVEILSNVVEALDKANQGLVSENTELKTENSLLKNQLIEKDGKINELEKSLLSAKSTAPATTPATAPKPLTGAAKVAAEAKAAKTVAATTSEADEAKKNS